MKIDAIVKEEVMRSLPVYFISFLIIGYLNKEGYILVGGRGIYSGVLYNGSLFLSYGLVLKKGTAFGSIYFFNNKSHFSIKVL